MNTYEVKFNKGNIVVIKTYDNIVDAITAAANEHGVIISERR